MAPSSDVNDTDEDKDEDESNNSIVHNLFDEPSTENIIIDESESECNIVNETLSQSDSSNVTTELNHDDHIKPSSNVKEAIYFNIFECGRNVLDKLDVTYQSAFAASKKPSTPSSVPPSAAYVYPLKKILYAFAASEKPSTPSSVPPPAYYVSPLKKQYWDVQTDNLKEKMAGMNEDYIIDAIYLLKHEDPEYNEIIIKILINEYDEYSVSCEGDGTDSAVSDELNKILT